MEKTPPPHSFAACARPLVVRAVRADVACVTVAPAAARPARVRLDRAKRAGAAVRKPVAAWFDGPAAWARRRRGFPGRWTSIIWKRWAPAIDPGLATSYARFLDNPGKRRLPKDWAGITFASRASPAYASRPGGHAAPARRRRLQSLQGCCRPLSPIASRGGRRQSNVRRFGTAARP